MKKVLIFASVLFVGFVTMCVLNYKMENDIPEITPIIAETNSEPPKHVKKEAKPEPKYILTEDEYADLAKLVFAEAEDQDDKGKRLVIDSVLNRVDHPDFPNTVHAVIFQKSQYYTVNFDKISVEKDTLKLINEELIEKTDSRVIFFRTGRYSDYGTPLYQYGDHYFSSLPVSD